MEVKFKKLRNDAVIPSKAHTTDVGYDIVAVDCEYDVDRDVYIYHTGLACETCGDENEVNVVFLYPRSSNSKTEAYLTNSVGVVDSDGYRGEIQARFKNRTAIKTLIDIETNKRVLESVLKTPVDVNYEELYNIIKNDVTAEYQSRAKKLEFAPYKVGDKCAQLVFSKEITPVIREVSILNSSERGEGGFGSTGK